MAKRAYSAFIAMAIDVAQIVPNMSIATGLSARKLAMVPISPRAQSVM